MGAQIIDLAAYRARRRGPTVSPTLRLCNRCRRPTAVPAGLCVPCTELTEHEGAALRARRLTPGAAHTGDVCAVCFADIPAKTCVAIDLITLEVFCVSHAPDNQPGDAS